VSQALLGQELTVYGEGTQTRTFCDVSDVVSAVVGLLDHPQAVGDVFNVGGTEEISILELAERIKAVTGSSSPVGLIPYHDVFGDQYEDTLRRVPDTTKIDQLLGWKPQRDLDGIIKRIVEYAERVGPDALLGEA
jgi:UDP-glucose 4-epimerase